MPVSQEVIELENQNLADAYDVLKKSWLEGNRDRDVGLHLMFLAWYGIIEPRHITGFPETDEMRQELIRTLNEVHAYFEPQIRQDAEMLYAVGLAARMFWFMLEDELEDARVWEKRGEDYHKYYRAFLPNGIDPKVFDNRGAYGEYYAGQAKVESGY